MKTKTIVIASQKGGTGKTMIADELAFACDREGIPYNLYDLDDQGSPIHQEVRNENAVVNIVDTPGALSRELQEYLSTADLVIIPMRLSPRDIQPLQTTIEQVKKYAPRKPVLFVFNGWNRYRAAAEFEDWFHYNYPKATTFRISQSEVFSQAALDASSVVEERKSSVPAKQVCELFDEVKRKLKIGEDYAR